MIEIDFHPGLHGNFLCYSINALDPKVREKSPFTQFGTSHESYPKILAHRPYHYSMYGQPFMGQQVISIYAEPEDCLLINLLQYSRAADYNLDLKNFEKDFYKQIQSTNFGAALRESLLKIFEVDIKYQNINRSQLREFFKYQFTNYEDNSAIRIVRKQQYAFPVMHVDFKRFYDFDEYIKVLHRTIDYFNLNYTLDDFDWYKQLWNNFISKIHAIKWEKDARFILLAIENRQFEPIDFNLLQESWLNARLEVVYNKVMPEEQENYFTNTKEIIEYLGI